MRATEWLKNDHATVKQMLDELQAIGPRDPAAHRDLLARIANALDVHARSSATAGMFVTPGTSGMPARHSWVMPG